MTDACFSWTPALLAAFLLAISPQALAAAATLANPWADAREPVAGKPQAIGGYSAGCVHGAESILADEGPTFQVMRKSRRRYFAQPEMRRFITKLAAEIRHREFGTLLVGDLGQAAWLNKLRPWLGHHYHFHVRLHCCNGWRRSWPGCQGNASPCCNGQRREH